MTDLHTWARRMEAWERRWKKRIVVGFVISIGSRRALVFMRAVSSEDVHREGNET